LIINIAVFESVEDRFEVLEMNTAWLNNGKYIFYFGVDIARNGELDFDKLYYSSVTLNVTE